MGIIIDLLLVAIVIISTFIGYKRGLINVIFSLCAFIISLVITFILYKPLTNFVIENTDFDEKIENIIIEKGITDTEKYETNEYVEKYISKSMTETKDELVESTATIISERLIGIIIGIVLFLLIRIILILAKGIINGISNLPFIKQCNELGGLIYGILVGILIIYVLLAILFFVVSINNTGIISKAIDSSYIAKMLYNNNIILNIIFK